jgi:hypothetical protein
VGLIVALSEVWLLSVVPLASNCVAIDSTGLGPVPSVSVGAGVAVAALLSRSVSAHAAPATSNRMGNLDMGTFLSLIRAWQHSPVLRIEKGRCLGIKRSSAGA